MSLHPPKAPGQLDPAKVMPLPSGDTVTEALATQDTLVVNGHGPAVRPPSEQLARQIQALQETSRPTPAPTPTRSHAAPWFLRPRFLLFATIGVVFLVGAGVLVAGWLGAFTPPEEGLTLERAERGSVIVTIVEKGELEAARNTDIVCRVRASGRGTNIATTIKWVIDNGTAVKQGDPICLLDDSALKDQYKNQEIVVAEKRNLLIQAEKDLDIIRSQNEIDNKTAENNVKLAELDYEKQTQGNLEQLRREVLGRITLARAEVAQWRDRLAWSNRMLQLGYLSASQAQNDESKLRSAEIALEKALEEQRVLESFDVRRTELEYRNKLDQAVAALKVAKIQADAKLAQADANYKAKKRIVEQEQAALEALAKDIENCTILAPHDGRVVHYLPESSRFGSSSSQQIAIQANESVRENQKLMRIPDMRQLQVKVKIHESIVSQVYGNRMRPTYFFHKLTAGLTVPQFGWGQITTMQGLVPFRNEFIELEEEIAEYGLPATVKIASLPKPLHGHVRSVAQGHSTTDFSSSDVRVYETIITIEDQVEGLRPGMTAEVTITVDDSNENVLRLPVHAVLERAGQKFCYVKNTQTGEFELRKLLCGLNNGKHVVILEGSQLAEGEWVVMNPGTLAERRKDLPADNSSQGERRGRRAGTAPTQQPPPAQKPAPSKPGKPGKPFDPAALVEKYRALSPEERKQSLERFRGPADAKKQLIEKLREAGIEIPD